MVGVVKTHAGSVELLYGEASVHLVEAFDCKGKQYLISHMIVITLVDQAEPVLPDFFVRVVMLTNYPGIQRCKIFFEIDFLVYQGIDYPDAFLITQSAVAEWEQEFFK